MSRLYPSFDSCRPRYTKLGDYRKGISYFEQALAIANEIGDKEGKGRRICNLGHGIHQEISTELLRRVGIEADIATNVREAVGKVPGGGLRCPAHGHPDAGDGRFYRNP
jgi:hypothetical protein